LADLHELELGRPRRDLLPADEVKAIWSRHIHAVRDRLLLMGSKLADRVAGQDAQACFSIIDREVRAVLTELSEYRDTGHC
jgi:hypothetical protein